MKISVIVSTYNSPNYLKLVLDALGHQKKAGNFEVVIADDGSGEETRHLIEKEKKSFPVSLLHAWQEDKGFRASASRNNAFLRSSGEYIVFLDGDCIPAEDFIDKHRRLAEKGFFVTGTRILLSEKFSAGLVSGLGKLETNNFLSLFKHYCCNEINKVSSALYLPFWPRKLATDSWKKLRSCNFGIWRDDFISVNGFDEDFVGWGFEDSDLAVRLINVGVKGKAGNFAVTAFHLYHKQLKTKKEGPGWDRLTNTIKSKKIWCKNGIFALKNNQRLCVNKH